MKRTEKIRSSYSTRKDRINRSAGIIETADRFFMHINKLKVISYNKLPQCMH